MALEKLNAVMMSGNEQRVLGFLGDTPQTMALKQSDFFFLQTEHNIPTQPSDRQFKSCSFIHLFIQHDKQLFQCAAPY